ncbi:MAG TPA: glycosyltransferase family 2 protein [Edaphobacter sp.]|nr:glycosyltransferase family 2 protein [Edaphobacter sp.]
MDHIEPMSGGKRLTRIADLPTSDLPLVTVITAVFNGSDCIAACIESVLHQNYPNIEHIILDGGSTDGTVAVLRKYEDQIALWKSEQDNGVYDAWNKGLELAQGEWIAFLGADDEYLPGAITTYMKLAREHPRADYLCSQVKWLHSSGYSKIIGGLWEWPRFRRSMCTAHVGSMHRRRLFKQYGYFDTSYRITADYEFLLRPGAELRSAFIKYVSVRMKAGGVSDSIAALLEASRAKHETGKLSQGTAKADLLWAILKYKVRSFVHPLLGRFRKTMNQFNGR